MKNQFIFWIVLLALSRSLASDTLVNRTIDVIPGGILDVNLGTGGIIVIRGWDEKAVKIVARLKGRDWRATTVLLDRIRSGARLQTMLGGTPSALSTSHEFEVFVPRKFDLQIESIGGNITINSITGSFRGNIEGGSITLKYLHGTANLSTRGGDINISNSDLEGSVTTHGGSVTLKDVHGSVITGSMTEEFMVKNSKSRKISIDLRTGSIDLDSAPDGAILRTGAGNITLKNASDNVDIKTGYGDITIESATGSVRAITGTGHVHIQLDTTASVEVQSGLGNVILVLTPNFSGELELQSGYTAAFGHATTIESDWPLSFSESKDFEDNGGTPQKYVRAKGLIGDRKSKVSVFTTNGDILVKRK